MSNNTFFNFFIFFIGSMTRLVVDFQILKRNNCLKTRFLSYLIAFQSLLEELYTFVLDLQYIFILF